MSAVQGQPKDRMAPGYRALGRVQVKPERDWAAIIQCLQADIAANKEEAIGRAAEEYFDLEDTPAVRSALAAYLLPLMAPARGGESAIACRLRTICRQRDPSSYVHRKIMASLGASGKMRPAKATAVEPALLESGAIDIELAVDPATEIDWQEVAMELTRRGRLRLSSVLDRYQRGLALLDRDRKFLRRKIAEVRWATLAVLKRGQVSGAALRSRGAVPLSHCAETLTNQRGTWAHSYPADALKNN